MEQWDFLLQKEGDRSWLPLDSPDVEILEGRYRVVARSNQVNTEVNVAISHVTVDEDPPKRRSKRRSGRTNANGLMVILPYTYLRAGIWQIICTSTDVMADLLGADWRRSVRLQVLANMGIEEENHLIAPPADRLTPSVELALPQETAPHQQEISPPLPAITPLTSQTIEPDLDDDGAEIDAVGLPELPALPTPETAPPPEAISTSGAVGAGSLPSLDDLASLNLEIAQVLGLSMDRLLEMTEQLSHQVVEEALRGLNLIELANSWRQSTEATSEEFVSSGREAAEVRSPEPAIAAEPASPAGESGFILVDALQLELECETLTACHGEALIIAGWIELNPAAEPIHPAQPFPDWLHASTELEVEDEIVPLTEAKVRELRLYLRDPQTSQVLWSDRQPVPAITARLPFSFNIVVPRDLTTHLLVGEVLLCGLLPDSSEDAIVVLKSQPFSVTVDPEQLMAEWAKVNQTLANHTDTEDMLDLPVQLSVELAESQQRSLLDLSFLKLAKTPAPDPEPDPESAVPASSATIGNSILPPQLYRPDPEQSGKKPLELPTFMAVAPAEPPAELTVELTNLESPVATDEESAAETLMPTNTDEAPVNEALTDESTDELEQTTIVQETDTCSVRELELDIMPEVLAAPLSPVQTAFQALNLQERFFDRLNALASDTDLKVSLQGAANGRIPNSHQSAAATMVSTDFAASEFVVDDDPEFDHWRQRRSTVLTRQAVAEESEQPNPLILPADEPVPVPTLEILADELVAGATVNIRVTLPNLLPRIYVKLWVNDRQTRSLLAGPQWLMDFFPNGFDALEAIVPLTVPMGSVEVRIEAIAVEIQTQRESRKVGLDQSVILDDFPLVSLDEFDL